MFNSYRIQDVLYEDDRVMYVSLHRYGEGFYPGTGAMDEVGTGQGAGYNVNVPWTEKGLTDADYLAAFDLVIDPIAQAFDPDLVIIAAGFDAAEGDPLGGMKVSDQGYALMTERLLQLAGGKCVAALEGGCPAAQACAVWTVGKIVYINGYGGGGPSKRHLGGAIAHLGDVTLIVMSFVAGHKLLNA